MLFFDLETHPFSRGNMAPRPVAGGFISSEGDSPVLALAPQAIDLLEACLLQGETLVGHGVSYDLACACAYAPRLLPLVFEAYQRRRVHCTEIRQKVIDIAAGVYRGFTTVDGKTIKISYGLADLMKRLFSVHRDKGEDTWRTRYAELEGVPIDAWPAAAREYLANDALDCLAIYQEQEKHRDLLTDSDRQAAYAWALRLCATWGITTDALAIDRLEASTREIAEALISDLKAQGFIRPDGSRDMGKIRSQVLWAYQCAGKAAPTTDKGAISTDAEALTASGDPALASLGRLGKLLPVLNKDLPLLREGLIHTRFDLAESGRSTSKASETGGGNIQNPSRQGGIRECFAPPPGSLYASADYGMLELCTLAQVCIALLGRSELAKALNAGEDPHLSFAASILGISYADAKARKAAGDPEIDQARQTAKVANFGFPGGLGITAFVAFAWATYKVRITEDAARKLKAQWFSRWPEMPAYFDLIGRMVEVPGAIKHLGSDRLRGNVGYTDACNSFFQGLGSDVAKSALFEVSRRCYTVPESWLYGCKPVNFVHDEIILEAPADVADRAAFELSAVMVEEAGRWLPDVSIKAEPLLSTCWSKSAKPIYTKTGRLIPWSPTP